MDEIKRTRLARMGVEASVAAAFGASICCIGPVAAVTFGTTSLVALSKYESLRSIFGVATLAFLLVAF